MADVFTHIDAELIVGGTSEEVWTRGIKEAQFFVATTLLDAVNLDACAITNESRDYSVAEVRF